MGRIWRIGGVLLAASIGSGCVGSDAPDTAITVQEERAGAGGQVGLDLLVTNGARAVSCGDGSLRVSLSASQTGAAGPFVRIDNSSVVAQCASGAADVAIVVDNSGSEQRKIDELKAGSKLLFDSVIAAGGRASLVRVSTQSQVLQELTDQPALLAAAADKLHVANGWTALWDGIRMGNETLGGDLESAPVSTGDVHHFCTASRKLAVVAFTDGRDNNSADEQAASYDQVKYPGDGIATSVDDLAKLRVDHISTPVYTVGIGRDVDEPSLMALSEATGGRYRRLTDLSHVTEAFADISDYFGSTHQVCGDLPWSVCGDITLQMDWSWTGNDGSQLSGTRTSSVHVPCEAQRGRGREATIVLTMSNPGISRSLASRLAGNAVDWVAPKSSPSVLVVLDDGHHGESVGDAAYVRDLLVERGYAATLVNERRGGILPADVAGYDVVWFTNPGYPWDDVRSVDTLAGFASAGGGVIAQGDDITWSLGRSFSLSRLTHLRFEGDGRVTCGSRTFNNAGSSFQVNLGSGHPLLEGIENATFMYGDDIDMSVPIGQGEQILGLANLPGGRCRNERPVISAFAP